jgi:hypothetical protein
MKTFNQFLDEAKVDNGLSDYEKESARRKRGNGGPTSHCLRRGMKTKGNMNHQYEPGKYQKLKLRTED